MAITAGDFIAKLAQQSGIDTSNPALVEILSNSEFSNYKLPDEVAGKINGSLMTYDSARNNEGLRRHFHAEILNGLDSNIESVIDRFGVEQDIAETIRAEKKTTEKYNRLIEKLSDLHARKSQATSKGDKKELEDEIGRLNSQVRELNDKLKAAPMERDQFWSDRLKDKAIQNTLSGYNYAGEKDIPKEVLMETARVLLNRKLNENKISVSYNTDQDTVSLKTESGMDYYKDNTPMSFKQFADSVLAESKMLTIPGASAPTNQAASPTPATPTIIGGRSNGPDMSKYLAALDDIQSGR